MDAGVSAAPASAHSDHVVSVMPLGRAASRQNLIVASGGVFTVDCPACERMALDLTHWHVGLK
jgi:hypothetical protein